MEKKLFYSTNIKHLRAINNVTQSELGKIIDKTDKAIYNYEQNTREPSAMDIYNIANYFGVSIEDLCFKDLRLESDNVELITPEEFANEVNKMLDKTENMSDKDKEHIKTTLEYICKND